MINGILFRARTGVPWRDLPEQFGCWKTVYERHRRWSAEGTWDRILQAVHTQADAEGRIDWSSNSLTRPSVSQTTDRTQAAAPTVVEKDTKSLAAERQLPLPDLAMEALTCFRAIQVAEKLAAGERYERSVRDLMSVSLFREG